MKAHNLISFILIPIIAIALSGFGINKSNQSKTNSIYPSPLDLDSLKKKNIKSDIPENTNWQSDAIGMMKNKEYNISYSNEECSYRAPNRENNILYTFSCNGYAAQTLLNKISSDDNFSSKHLEDSKGIEFWKVGLHLNGIHRSGIDIVRFNGTDFNSNENLAQIEDDNIRINYTNDAKGLRQDFIVKQKPEGKGYLKLKIVADTKLKLKCESDAIHFKDMRGQVKMTYSSLKCWDANGKDLPSHFTGSNSKSFAIVVDDEDAVYPITIDPLSYSPDWTAESNQANTSFGISVATAGDVNGDGYSDVIIGAQKYDAGQTNEGKVFVYHGSATGLSSIPNWTAESNQAEAFFGHSVATAGDVNGDGYSDVIIGAQIYDNGQIDEGRAFVYHGSASGLSLTPNWTGESNQDSAQFGISVATAGDVNNDGRSDIIVGAWLYNNGQTNEGKAFVYLGSSSGLSAIANWTFESNQADAYFGYSVAWAGNTNGDVFADVIIGAYKYGIGGAAFLFSGTSSGLSSTYSWMLASGQADANYGYSVSTAGDANADGLSDVIIGANEYDEWESNNGKIFYLRGSTSTGLTPFWSYSQPGPNNLGVSVSCAGDVNGDGYSDIIAGAHKYSDGESQEGAFLMFYGSPYEFTLGGDDVFADWFISSNQPNSYFGASVATAGDVNGDGFSDIIVGAYSYSEGQTDEGKAFTFYGSAERYSFDQFSEVSNIDQIYASDESQAFEKYGYSIGSAGDVNGDQCADIIVGAPEYDNIEVNEGRALVYYGSMNFETASDWTAESNSQNAFFGKSVSTAGDVNGDGFSDILVGAPLFSNGEIYEGKVFLYYGSLSGISSTPNWSAEGNSIGAEFGSSVATAGDVNGDGYSDIIIGAPEYADAGKVFVYYGSSGGLPNSFSWSAEGGQLYAEFGSSVSSAGDVNGDGYADVILGAPEFDNGQNGEGRACVYFGSSNGLSSSSPWIMESNLSNAAFGNCVAVAGDVNGDGFSDVIIGASEFDSPDINEGKAFVYHGSSTGPSSSSNWNAAGTLHHSFFGYSVCGAGDINGDGYSDVAVTNLKIHESVSGVGIAAYFGSSTGLSNVADFNKFVNLGVSGTYSHFIAASGGDLNCDGFSDLIAGIPDNFFRLYRGNVRTGINSLLSQYKVPAFTGRIMPGGFSGTDGTVKLQFLTKGIYGNTFAKMVYEYKPNGVPFSGNQITNSTQSSGEGSYGFLNGTWGTFAVTPTDIPINRHYKWRARLQYKLSYNPFQKFGPWRYFNNSYPIPFEGFKAQSTQLQPIKQLVLNLLMQGFYNPVTNMLVSDTATVYLRSGTAPFSKIDSAITKINAASTGVFKFYNAQNGVGYYLQVKHRNSVETWSSAPVIFTSNSAGLDFTTTSTQAYGNNLIQVDASPMEYALYSGDVNQDGYINLTDVVNVYNAASIFLSGYKSTDVNGDNITDLSDVVITNNNSDIFVRVRKP